MGGRVIPCRACRLVLGQFLENNIFESVFLDPCVCSPTAARWQGRTKALSGWCSPACWRRARQGRRRCGLHSPRSKCGLASHVTALITHGCGRSGVRQEKKGTVLGKPARFSLRRCCRSTLVHPQVWGQEKKKKKEDWKRRWFVLEAGEEPHLQVRQHRKERQPAWSETVPFIGRTCSTSRTRPSGRSASRPRCGPRCCAARQHFPHRWRWRWRQATIATAIASGLQLTITPTCRLPFQGTLMLRTAAATASVGAGGGVGLDFTIATRDRNLRVRRPLRPVVLTRVVFIAELVLSPSALLSRRQNLWTSQGRSLNSVESSAGPSLSERLLL